MRKKFIYLNDKVEKISTNLYYDNLDVKYIGNILGNDSFFYGKCIVYIDYDYLKEIKKIIFESIDIFSGGVIIYSLFTIPDKEIVDFLDSNNIDYYIFSELWDNTNDLFYGIKNYFNRFAFLPVSAYDENVKVGKLNKRPNKNIFISLGNKSIDFKLISKIIDSNRDLTFYIPNVTYLDIRDEGIKWINIDNLDYDNCKVLETNGYYTNEYIDAMEKCDTFLILFDEKDNYQMVGGTRLATAIFMNKYIIISENYSNELYMANNKNNCLITDNSLQNINGLIYDIQVENYKNSEEIYSSIRENITLEGKRSAIKSFINGGERVKFIEKGFFKLFDFYKSKF